jgi:hypothetical protein
MTVHRLPVASEPNPSRTWLALAMSVFMPAAGANDHVWMIGGGPNRNSSEVQIEQNVIWVSRVLRELPGKPRVDVYFTDGLATGDDVKEQRAAREAWREPLSRVFAEVPATAMAYRNHRVPDVAGGTERSQLVPQLEKSIRHMAPADQGLLVFHGHGSKPDREQNEHRMGLWNNTWLSVRDMEQLVAQAPAGSTVRAVFAQC